MAMRILKHGQSVNTYASSEAIDRGHCVSLSSGVLVKGTAGGGLGFARSTHTDLSTGTNIYSDSWDGRRNMVQRSEQGDIGDIMGVETGDFLAEGFDKYYGTVSENDVLFCIGSGTLANLAVASGVEGFDEDTWRVAAIALTGGTAGTDTIKIMCKLP